MKSAPLTRAIAFLARHMANPFRLDLRSIALYRVVIGIVLLADIVMRWIDMTAHYTNQGVLSYELAQQSYASFSFSIHGLVDAWWWTFGLFALQAVFACMLIVGYRTRLAVAVSFLLLVSLQNRNDVILNSGDVLLRAQLFWSILLPLNKRFSVDLAQNRVLRTAKKTAFSPATMAIVVQGALVFWQTAAFKSGVTWRENFEALYITLNAEAFSTPWGTWLSQFRSPMRMFTWAAITIEDIAPILLVTPFFTRFAQGLGLALLVGLYGGIISLMSVGIFPFIGIATLLVVIPGFAWDRAASFIEQRRQHKQLTVYYDQSCGVCVLFVRLLSAFGLTYGVKVKHVYENKTITNLSNKHNSWVGRIGRTNLYKADVFREILRRSYVWWVFVPLMNIGFVYRFANRIYEHVSSHRTSVCRPPKPIPQWKRALSLFDTIATWGAQVAVLLLLVTVFVWVQADMPKNNSALGVYGAPRKVVRALRLDQYWNMFSPNPLSYTSWPVLEATSADGTVYDAWRPYWADDSVEISYDRPDHAYAVHVSPRWRRYLTRVSGDGYSEHQKEFLRYMCNDWNQKNPSQVVEQIKYIEFREETYTDSSAKETITRQNITSQYCEI